MEGQNYQQQHVLIHAVVNLAYQPINLLIEMLGFLGSLTLAFQPT